MTSKIRMPEATMRWLVDNTGLSFKQISVFCGMHDLEVQAYADDDSGYTVRGQDPIAAGQLTRQEIERCESDDTASLVMVKPNLPQAVGRTKGPRYTPLSKRGDKPDAIAWLVKNYPDLPDSKIIRLIGTTKKTIVSLREKTYANIQNIDPRSPVSLGLCAQEDLDSTLAKAGIKATDDTPSDDTVLLDIPPNQED